MNYVLHFCRNKLCNNGWLDKDLTHCKTNPPKWKYCPECCKELGIDFDSQKPSDSYSEEKKEHIEKMRKKNNKIS